MMIERQEVGGRMATVSYLDADFHPVRGARPRPEIPIGNASASPIPCRRLSSLG